MLLCQSDQIGVGHVGKARDRRHLRSRQVIGDELCFLAVGDVFQRRHCIREARPVAGTQAHPREAELRNRAGGKARLRFQPRPRLRMVCMGLPRAREEEVHIKKVAHGKSARMDFTASVVIGGASSGATSTLRPPRPFTSRACAAFTGAMTSFSPSSEKATLSPGWRCSALR